MMISEAQIELIDIDGVVHEVLGFACEAMNYEDGSSSIDTRVRAADFISGHPSPPWRSARLEKTKVEWPDVKVTPVGNYFRLKISGPRAAASHNRANR